MREPEPTVNAASRGTRNLWYKCKGTFQMLSLSLTHAPPLSTLVQFPIAVPAPRPGPCPSSHRTQSNYFGTLVLLRRERCCTGCRGGRAGQQSLQTFINSLASSCTLSAKVQVEGAEAHVRGAYF
ncbi:hypothetical protein GWK47_013193 [Chionoecetes opilio]|uniref:Uncharacterized protein n=1 Tax=Chionoecetes opilio TaxID=41210 RepID=A0A8J4XUK5_CHIOP|nr:hypothetical protein GWK47_013193 [Chionoecetes opilio]